MHKAGVLMGAHAMLICPGASVCMIVAPFTSSYADNISQASTSVRFRMKQYIEKKSGVKVAMNMGSGRCDDKFHNVTTIISDAVTRDECVCMCVCVYVCVCVRVQKTTRCERIWKRPWYQFGIVHPTHTQQHYQKHILCTNHATLRKKTYIFFTHDSCITPRRFICNGTTINLKSAHTQTKDDAKPLQPVSLCWSCMQVDGIAIFKCSFSKQIVLPRLAILFHSYTHNITTPKSNSGRWRCKANATKDIVFASCNLIR